MFPATSESRTLLLGGGLAALSIAAFLLRATAPGVLDRVVRVVQCKTFWAPATVAIVAGFVALPLVNAAYPGYLDHAEPNVAAVSWLALKGTPLYHELTAPSRYTLLYGPSCYLPYAAGLWIGGGSVVSLRCVVLAANLAIVSCLWRSYREILDGAAALLALAFVLVFLYVPQPNNYLLQIRSDVLVECAIAVGLLAVSLRSSVAGPLIMGVAAAFVIDAKVIAFIYVVPLFGLFAARRGRRATLAAALCTLVAASLPFLLPNVALHTYLEWLHRASGHPTSASDLMSTLRTLPILVSPLLLMVGPLPWRVPGVTAYARKNRLRLLALLACLVCAVVSSGRIGAGSHYLLPLVPVLGYECALLYRATGAPCAIQFPMAFRYAWSCVALVVVIRVGGGVRETVSGYWSQWRRAGATLADVHAILRKYGAHEIQMGYGDVEDPVTYFRPEVVFATNHLLLDEQALSDMGLDGVPLPAATIDAIAGCASDVWLIPRGKSPFAIRNYFGEAYPGVVRSQRMFSASFVDAFMGHYSKVESIGAYDLWMCDGRSALQF
jgi:hypothetical protein